MTFCPHYLKIALTSWRNSSSPKRTSCFRASLGRLPARYSIDVQGGRDRPPSDRGRADGREKWELNCASLTFNTYVRIISRCPSLQTAIASSKLASRSCSAKAMAGQGCATSSPRRQPRRGRSPTTFARRKNSRARCSTSISSDLKRLVAEALGDADRLPRERLRRYLDIITDRLADAEFSRGCLIGDFSLEAAPQSEVLRTRLSGNLRRVARAFRRMHRRRPGGWRDRRDLRAA